MGSCATRGRSCRAPTRRSAAAWRSDAGQGGDGPSGRADRGHRPRGAQRARHDPGLRAAAGARACRRTRRPRRARIREECETLETVVRRFMDFVKRETLQLGDTSTWRGLLSRVVARESTGPTRRCGRGSSASTRRSSIRADEELLERAFENLVRNAARPRRRRRHVERVARGTSAEQVVVTVDGRRPRPRPRHPRELRPFYTTGPGASASASRSPTRSSTSTGRAGAPRPAPHGLGSSSACPPAGPTLSRALRMVRIRQRPAPSRRRRECRISC